MRNPLADYLIEDHAHLDELLTRAAGGDGGFDIVAFETFRGALLRHMAIEERVVFGDAKGRRRGTPLPDARHVRIEHAALAMLTVPTPDRALAGEIRQLLLEHSGAEEGPGGAFDQHAALASEAELAELAAQAAAWPQMHLRAHVDLPDAVRTAATALRKGQRAVSAPSEAPAAHP